jgi:23S rRNA (guanosine2251-2'-O)-methyltransferase
VRDGEAAVKSGAMSEPNDLIYGIHPVEEALRNPRRRFVALTASRNAADRLAADITRAGVAATIVHPRDLDKRLGPDAVHQGVLLEAKPLPQPRLDQIEKTGVVVLLDQVTDPHNVGAILRTCAAFKVTALVATARHSPEASGVLLKSASGAYEHVPFVKVTNLARAMEELKGHGFRVAGLDSEAQEVIGTVDRTPPLALVLGAEGKGLRQLTRQMCDALVRLDLNGPIRSLNVSNAAAIALYVLAG